ncbi:efflux RND transporter permease subunit [SAR92 clade bacterium H231]|jgi:multidrug efflux pump subunit AcrB|nr:efflux RND transporter permease subunit [SAR92 clade bacterium H231]MDG1199586.1 efflux RND transporter permease subunit [Porticoccaceae bacterium]
MKKIVDLYLDRPRLFLLAMLFIIAGGLLSYDSLPRQENPQLAERWGDITAVLPGATPQRMETQVADVLETQLREIDEIKTIESRSFSGMVSVGLEFKEDVGKGETDEVWAKVQDMVSESAALVPPGTSMTLSHSGPPTTVLFALQWRGDGDPQPVILSRLASQLKRKLANIVNSEKALIFGDTQEEIFVGADLDLLTDAGMNIQSIATAIDRYDSKRAIGNIVGQGSEFRIKAQDNIRLVNDLRKLPLKTLDANQIIRLEDVATVEKLPVDPPIEIVSYNGKPSVFVDVRGKFSQRTDLYSSAVLRVADSFKAGLPDEIGLEVIYNESDYVEEKFSFLMQSILLATFIVLFLSYLLLGPRSAVIVSAVVPLTILLVLIGCTILDIPLHQTSVTGIILSLGLLIDNSIIVVEDYKYRKSLNLVNRQAIYASIRHLSLPLLAATVTTGLAFMPMAAGKGASPEFVGDMAITIILAVTSSLFLALTVVPVLLKTMEDSNFLNLNKSQNSGFSHPGMRDQYRKFLAWAFYKPSRALILSLILPMLGFVSFGFLDTDFFPNQGKAMFRVDVELDANASIYATNERIASIRDQVLLEEYIETDMWWVGRRLPRLLYNVIGGSSGEGSDNLATGVFFTSSFEEMDSNLADLAKRLEKDHADIRVRVSKFTNGPPVEFPVVIAVFGEDIQILKSLGEELKSILAKSPQVVDVLADQSASVTGLQINFDEVNLAFSSKSSKDIINEISSSTRGLYVGSMLDGNKEIPIRIKNKNRESSELNQAAFLAINSAEGFDYVESFSDISYSSEINQINRYQGSRNNAVKAAVYPGTLGSNVLTDVADELRAFEDSLPTGYSLKQFGDAEERAESFGQIFSTFFFFMGLIVVALVMILNSFRQASIILFVGTLCIGLGFLGMFVGFQNFGFIGLVGIVGLAGLAINDSIVVLSHLNEDAGTGKISKHKLIETTIRSTRHIVTTSLTTMGGLLPLLFDKFFETLAWAMCFGVMGSALLALLLIPSMFCFLGKVHQ